MDRVPVITEPPKEIQKEPISTSPNPGGCMDEFFGFLDALIETQKCTKRRSPNPGGFMDRGFESLHT